jgi:hypothetical protein
LVRLEAARAQSESEAATLQHRLLTLRGEIAHLWEIQLAALKPEDHVWMPSSITQHSALFERRQILAIHRRGPAGHLLVASPSTAVAYINGPYTAALLLDDHLLFLPSPAGDHQETALISAFFDPAILIFKS